VHDRIISPIKQCDRIEMDHLIGHSLNLLACAQVANVGNLVFQAAMMRMLVIRRFKTGHSSALENRPPCGRYWVEESSSSALLARVLAAVVGG
jgi:hypothetical protein